MKIRDSVGTMETGGGLEMALGWFFLRGGFGQAGGEGIGGPTAGCGFALNGWALDYAFSAPLDQRRHQVAVSYHPEPGEASAPSEEEAPDIDPVLLKDADKPLPKPDLEESVK